MKLESLRAQSAALLFNISGARLTVFMRAFGDPEHVRKALRASVSHRRSIVVSRPQQFVGNAYLHLAKQAQDLAEPWTTEDAYERGHEAYEWNYTIYPRGVQGAVYIKFYQRDKSPIEQPLFSFIGTEYKREYKFTEARKRALKGRPRENWIRNGMWKQISNLTPAQRQRYERLAKAREAKAHRRVEQQQAITSGKANAARSGKTLGLKNKEAKRIISVDFSDVFEDLRAMSHRDIEEMDPGYFEELSRIYGSRNTKEEGR